LTLHRLFTVKWYPDLCVNYDLRNTWSSVVPTTHSDVSIAAQWIMGARHQPHIIVTQALLYQYPGKLRRGMMGNAVTIRDGQRDLLSLKGEFLSMKWTWQVGKAFSG